MREGEPIRHCGYFVMKLYFNLCGVFVQAVWLHIDLYVSRVCANCRPSDHPGPASGAVLPRVMPDTTIVFNEA